ncbi:hypothetical protein LNTAR_21240 [Lentisphaera araneosa HTCC2155]|uniref:FlgD Ig-like domain-containing protein n=1 Tax=Lentisphaera araneosa HTCC2155 TaxID=313628 RepID=A6DLY2_9BACT|nr:hypothetical protein [Lentisphaera araneosa]EDM27280.1 hypothetical protein LNTAR_21240 [Lentisphaera araneosa HTCC2155]
MFNKKIILATSLSLVFWGCQSPDTKIQSEVSESPSVEMPRKDSNQAPIAIPLVLEKDSHVTMVIENQEGTRVRNILKDQFFKAGSHWVYWDGMDDHGRANIGPHGNYTQTGRLVDPGQYTVRTLIHDKIDITYEFTPYSPTNPSWRNADASGQWLADHTPPSSVLYLPSSEQMLIGSSLAEGAHGLVWTDIEGEKIRGVQGIGGGWAGAVRLTLDKAGQDKDVLAYGLGASRHGEVSIVAIGEEANKTLFNRKEKIKHQKSHYIVDYPVAGLAVYKKLAVISYSLRKELAFFDLSSGKQLSQPNFVHALEDPRGLAFDAKGNLFVLHAKQLTQFKIDGKKLVQVKVVNTKDLSDPQELIIDGNGDFYISDHGDAHQVKVFNTQGKLLRTIGTAGKPSVGKYDETKMHYPMGLTLTSSGELWVAEEDYQPKRVSIWSKEGTFKKAFYGSTEYGGGGKIDPLDKTRFYYFGMEFELDWEKGTDKITNIFYRRDKPNNIPFSSYKGDLAGNPETPIYINGRQYMTNTYTGHPVRGGVTATIWLVEDGIAKPVAALGQANFESFLKTEAYKDKIPAEHDITVPANQQWRSDRTQPYENAVIYAWSDLNDDQKIQVEEVQLRAGKVGGLNQDEQLNFYTADALKIAVSKIDKKGVPHYDLEGAQRISSLGVPIPYTVLIPASNGDIAFCGFVELEPNGKAYGSVSGITADGRRWYYPNQWTGLHASQSYPINREPKPGDIIGTTKVIGTTFKVSQDKEELWALNANSGQIYLFTTDGLFVTALFKHGYFAKANPLKAERGIAMDDYTSDGEGFWQTITKTADGNVYVQAMNHTSSINRVNGLNSLQRLPLQTINVSKTQLDDCLAWFSKAEAQRQAALGKKSAKVAIRQDEIALDGNLDDWAGADWLAIDDRTWGAMRLSEDKLYLAYKTLHKNLVKNSGSDPWQGMFKTGGALDLMISTSGNDKRHPKSGDQRLLMSEVNGKLRAIHYEQKSKHQGHASEIASPNRTVKFDYIADVSEQVQWAQGKTKVAHHDTNVVFGTKVQLRNGDAYEVAVPLKLIGLNPQGQKITGDIGVLLGNGNTTTRRLYWSNKNTVMLFDAPEESLLKPALWGELKLKVEKKLSFEELLQERGDAVDLYTGLAGELDIKNNQAQILWSGQGTLRDNKIGRLGFVIFRPYAKDWFSDDVPLVKLSDKIGFKHHKIGRFNDGLYAGSKVRKISMNLDGKSLAGPKKILGGALWPRQKKAQVAHWDFEAKDDKLHQMTIIIDQASQQSFSLTNAKGEERQLIQLKGDEGLCVIQFNFSGKVRLNLKQAPYTDQEIAEKKRKPAAITAIFVD